MKSLSVRRATRHLRRPFSVRTAASTCLLVALAGCGGGGGGSDAAPAINVAATAAVNSVSSTSVEVGKTLTVTGSNLDRVTSFTINGVSLRIVAVSPGSATLAMPDTATSGVLTLTVNGASTATGFSLTAYPTLTVAGYAPASAAAGATIVVTGTGLGTVSQVRFSNGSTAAVTQPHSDTSLSFVVPEGAASGAIVLVSPYRETSTSSFTVFPSVTVTSISSSSDSVLRVTVSGTNLNGVTSARVGNVPAVINQASASEMILTVALGTSGTVVLTSPAGDLSAGAVAAQNYTIGTVDVAQVFSRNISNTALKVTPGRPMLVRASVLGLSANLDSPTVRLTGVSGAGAMLGSLTMSGPARLPTSRDEYDLANTFSVVVPDTWVRRGLKLAVSATGADNHVATGPTHVPAIGSNTKIHLYLVPISYNGVIGKPPGSLQSVKDAFLRTYPYGPNDVVVSLRAPLVVTGSGSTADSAWWDDALTQLETARSAEQPGGVYYGLVHKDANAGIVGLGYVNDRNTGTGFPSAIGIEADNSVGSINDPFGNLWPAWLATMLHEVGHNHSLEHVAGCDNPDSTDPAYPYSGGALGPMPVYNSLYAGVVPGGLKKAVYGTFNTPMKDVMTYCADGAWLSDYSYAAAQTFAEARSAIYPAPRMLAAERSAGDYLTVSGSISGGTVRLDPADASSQRRYAAAIGTNHDYTLRVRTAAGQTFDYAFDAMRVGDGEAGLRHFNVSLPNPGEVSGIEVLYKGARLVQPAARNAAAGGAPSFAAQVSDGKLNLTWNAGAEPAATVVYVADDGNRMLLAKNLRGGSASVDIKTLPAGGSFEVSLSTSIKARLVKVAR
ncbi:IPT/TIG domain-containing protein [Massilia aurea]|uniref:IPT/TIG domain-containing protein n=1 Tax=Massilia aurea TaxID=373040 RepID=UPI002161BC7B|nr:IPT/TIG domain-containing protein [Massilia aurea]MCS0707289.1 IPT/TIG domain-containing protein [Massilia aurea]